MAEMAGFDHRVAWESAYARPDPDGPILGPGEEERAIVAVLRELAGDGPVLELAVGNGRIAIPLAATGVEVDGIDISPNAIDQLRRHPQGAAVNASVADISDFALDRRYSLIYCVANSLFNLLTQDGQIRCFELVATHLEPGGVFLVHSSYTPRWFEMLRNGQYVEARHFELGFAFLQAVRVDPGEQLVYQQNISLTKGGIHLSPSVHRYASLGELDLMARLAGLERLERWGSWTREPYRPSTTWGALPSAMLLAAYRKT